MRVFLASFLRPHVSGRDYFLMLIASAATVAAVRAWDALIVPKLWERRLRRCTGAGLAPGDMRDLYPPFPCE